MSGETRVVVYMSLPDEAYRAGWDADATELEGSIRATLHELNGDDGQVYVPKVYGVEVEPEEVSSHGGSD